MQYLFQLDVLLQVSGMTPGRAAALLPVVLGLFSVIIGWKTLRSRSIRVTRPPGAIITLGSATLSVILSGLHLFRTAGSAIGTGSGRLGAIVALVSGVIGLVLGALALARAKRKVSSHENQS